MIAKTYEERMDLIAALAPKYNKIATLVRIGSQEETKHELKSFDTDNINHWSDAPEFVRDQYGHVYLDTVEMDKDWGDY